MMGYEPSKDPMLAMDFWRSDEPVYQDLRKEIESLRQQLATVTAERDEAFTVMVAAAEEIHTHWDAHCDAEGYGPSNLMHRLENGIATLYPSYTAGAFSEMQEQLATVTAERDKWKYVGEEYLRETDFLQKNPDDKWVGKKRIDVLVEAFNDLAAVTKERDELVEAATALIESVRITDRDVAWDGLKAALAKVGTGKTGEV